MFLEKLKLQLFAANNEDEEPEDSEQDEEETDDVDESEDLGEEEATEEEDAEGDEEETDTEKEQTDDEHVEDEEKPFMVFKSKREHQEYMDNVIGKRLGKARETEKTKEEYENIIETFKQYYDVENIDGLKKKADELLDDIAYKQGTTKEKLLKQQENAKKLQRLEALEQEQIHQTFVQAVKADCEKLIKTNPDLYDDVKADDLIDNKEFIALLRSGVPFKKAYDALNLDKIIEKQTAKAKKNVIDDVKAKGKRITENATKKSKAGAIKIDVNKMTDAQLEDLEERARNGERITF